MALSGNRFRYVIEKKLQKKRRLNKKKTRWKKNLQRKMIVIKKKRLNKKKTRKIIKNRGHIYSEGI